MKKKWIVGSVLALAGVLIVALAGVAFSLGGIVKKGVERIGPKATQVEVKLKTAEVWLVGGRVQLTGFVLGNPPGYRTPLAIAVEDVSVHVRPGSVFSDKMVVESIEVKAPVITLEGGLKDNNLKRIEKNLDDYLGASSAAPDTPAGSTGPAKEGKKFQVNELEITGAKLQVNMALTRGRTITLSIPDIHLTDLGTGPEGITAAAVGQQALQAIVAAATAEVTKQASELGKQAGGQAQGAVKKGAELLKGLLQH